MKITKMVTVTEDDRINIRFTLENGTQGLGVLIFTDEGVIMDLYDESGEVQELINTTVSFFTDFEEVPDGQNGSEGNPQEIGHSPL